jgi:hypothetical protein
MISAAERRACESFFACLADAGRTGLPGKQALEEDPGRSKDKSILNIQINQNHKTVS